MSDLYAVLGVSPKASADEIQKAHKKLVFEHHPDKQRKQKVDANGLDVKSSDASNTANDMLFTQISQAYHVLGDPIQRAQYDLSRGYTTDSAEERVRINRLKRSEAESALGIMEETVEALRQQQHNKKGLVIVNAHYGDLSDSNDSSGGDGLAHIGRSIDVTVPLQLLVDSESSQLVIHAGQSKAGLEGFYDPLSAADDTASAAGTKSIPRRLYVRYLYGGETHEITVDDRQPLVLPLIEHKLSPELAATAASASSATAASAPSHQSILAQIHAAHALAATKRQRRWLAAGTLAIVVGVAALYATDRLPPLPSFLRSSAAAHASSDKAVSTAQSS